MFLVALFIINRTDAVISAVRETFSHLGDKVQIIRNVRDIENQILAAENGGAEFHGNNNAW